MSFADYIRERWRDPRFPIEYAKLEATEKVLEAMKEAGLTQAELAERAGLHPATVSDFLRHAHDMRALEILALLAWAMGKRVEITLKDIEP